MAAHTHAIRRWKNENVEPRRTWRIIWKWSETKLKKTTKKLFFSSTFSGVCWNRWWRLCMECVERRRRRLAMPHDDMPMNGWMAANDRSKRCSFNFFFVFSVFGSAAKSCTKCAIGLFMIESKLHFQTHFHSQTIFDAYSVDSEVCTIHTWTCSNRSSRMTCNAHESIHDPSPCGSWFGAVLLHAVYIEKLHKFNLIGRQTIGMEWNICEAIAECNNFCGERRDRHWHTHTHSRTRNLWKSN